MPNALSDKGVVGLFKLGNPMVRRRSVLSRLDRLGKTLNHLLRPTLASMVNQRLKLPQKVSNANPVLRLQANA